MTRFRALLLATALTIVMALATAAPASAHAELRETSPPPGAQVDDPPRDVLLRFTEPVEASLGAIRVHDEDAARVDSGSVTRPGGDRRGVQLRLPDLDPGGYVVTWRVVSVDGHPIHGAFTFRVGPAAGADTTVELARRLLAEDGGDAGTGFAYAVARLAVFAGLLGLVGGGAFVLFVWPPARSRRDARRLLWTWWAVTVAGTLAAVGLHGAHGAGLGLSRAVDPDVVSAAIDTRYGRVSGVRLAVLVGVAGLLAVLGRGQRAQRPALLAAAFVLLTAALVATPGLAGHAGSGELVVLAVPADALHVAAAAAWLGGLAILAATLLRNDGDDEAASAVSRFSTVAGWAVAIVVVTGSLQSWRQVRAVDAATGTTYGRLLLLKVGIVALLVAGGAMSRRWVRSRASAPALSAGAMVAPASMHSLRRTVAVELALAVAVLAVTSLLVDAAPARVAMARPHSAELAAGDVLVDVTVDPAKAGNTDIHLYTLTREGAVREVEEITLRMTLPAQGIGPIDVPVRRAGPGHFAAYGFDLPIAGEWRLDATVRLTDVDQVQASTTVPVR